MFDRVLTESGQFILDTETLELDFPKFARLVRSVLGTYNKYSPQTYLFNIHAQGKEYFDFTDSFIHPMTQEIIGIPAWISSATPIRSRSNLSPFFQTGAASRLPGASYGGVLDLVDKDPTPYVYRKPRLHLAYPGLFDIKAQYYHVITGSGDLQEVKTLDEKDDIFFELLAAKFLISIGRNRRAFTLNPLELVTDASELVSEGTSQWDSAKDNLIENHASFSDTWD